MYDPDISAVPLHLCLVMFGDVYLENERGVFTQSWKKILCCSDFYPDISNLSYTDFYTNIKTLSFLNCTPLILQATLT